MVREMVTIQVGQCGNQIGRMFWEQALAEHAVHNQEGLFDEAMSSFFRNVETHSSDVWNPLEIPLGNGLSPIVGLKARAVLVDTEDGVVSETLRGSLGELFEKKQIITDVSGAGNNWSHGYMEYGPKHEEGVREATRRAAEFCDSLQCFFLLHSLGGGTGSGLGTFILSLLEDEFPSVFRFTTSVFPSEDDDVITSPYNSVLSTHELIKHADCVLPLENQQLADISSRIKAKKDKMTAGRPTANTASRNGRNWIHKPTVPNDRERSVGVGVAGTTKRGDKKNSAHVFPSLKSGRGAGGSNQPRAAGGGRSGRGREGFDGMNAIGARLLTHLTSSMRFPGQLNTDMNEISTNLVPFPHLHFLCSSLAPLDPELGPVFGAGGTRSTSGGGTQMPRQQVVRQLFSDAFSPSHQLLRVDQRQGTYLASALLLRGDLSIGDVNTCMAKVQPSLSTIHWNSEGFKVGLCSAAALEHPHAVLCLTNNTCIAETFDAMLARFSKLYSRRAMVHHFSEFIGDGDTPQLFADAEEALSGLSASYREFDSAAPPTEEELKRIVPFV